VGLRKKRLRNSAHEGATCKWEKKGEKVRKKEKGKKKEQGEGKTKIDLKIKHRHTRLKTEIRFSQG